MEAPNETGADPGAFFAVLRRRRRALLIPFGLILLAGFALAYTIPPTYKAEATILIERQEIPAELVETTVTGYVEERIQGITQRLLTHENLWAVAERIDYAPQERTSHRSEIVQRMRDGIQVEMVDVQTSNPGNGKQTLATVAFTVAFEAPVPEVAQRGANALAELYLAEERRARVEQAAEVSRFLEMQARQLSEHISHLERQLAAFKQQNVANLPELTELNLRLLEQTDEKVERSEERIRALEERKLLLESQLVMTEPGAPIYADDGRRLLTPSERLSVLRAEYLAASAKYGAGHPDLARLEREIALLEEQGAGRPGVNELAAELERLRSQLAESRDRYSEAHPDVKKLKRSIASLEEKMRQSAPDQAQVRAALAQAPDNPAYIRLQTELDTVVAGIRTERERIAQLNQKREQFEKRLYQTPMVEKEYLELSRDYKTAMEKYRDLKDKQLRAGAAEQLEMGEKAQRFALIGPAVLPTDPDKPNRLGIILLGSVLALGGGLGSAAFAEYQDRSIRGSRGIEGVFGAPPLAVIPYIDNDADRMRQRIARVRSFVLVVVFVGGVLGVVHYFWLPLDQLVERLSGGVVSEAEKPQE